MKEDEENKAKKDKPKKKKKRSHHTFSNELVLLIFGALIGIMGNQLFFHTNKDYEAEVLFQKEVLKEQYEYVNRVLLFTYRTETTNWKNHITRILVTNHIDGSTGESTGYTTDTTLIDTITIDVPSFIASESSRETFLRDIEYIKDNKNKIDYRVYMRFQVLLDFLVKHPLPETVDVEEAMKTDWVKKSVQNKWWEKCKVLHDYAFEFLYLK